MAVTIQTAIRVAAARKLARDGDPSRGGEVDLPLAALLLNSFLTTLYSDVPSERALARAQLLAVRGSKGPPLDTAVDELRDGLALGRPIFTGQVEVAIRG